MNLLHEGSENNYLKHGNRFNHNQKFINLFEYLT